jgi:protein-S-isoprenylcysteine O-methyltransferase Ste14
MNKQLLQLMYIWLVPAIWLAWVTYWLVRSGKAQHTAERETPTSRQVHLALVGGAFALILVPVFRIGPLGWRWLPRTPPAFFLGVTILAAGCGFAVWARHHLGTNWSGTIAVKEEHELIQSGPYSYARHPIYTGWIFGMVGSAVALGEVRGILAVLLFLGAYIRKVRIEEKWLAGHFGQAYINYRKNVKALIPFVW